MAPYNFQVKGIFVFIVLSIATYETSGDRGIPVENSPLFPNTDTHHLIGRALGITRLGRISSPISNLLQNDIGSVGSTFKVNSIHDPTKENIENPQQARPVIQTRSSLARYSRGRINRMPLNFGKRLNLKTELIVLDRGDRGDYFMQKRRGYGDQQTPSDIREHSTKHARTKTHKYFTEGERLNPDTQSLKTPNEMSAEFENDGWGKDRDMTTWKGKDREGRKENWSDSNGFISQRAVRGRLDRMPSGFGKRGRVNVPHFFKHIDRQGSQEYERAFKRLANRYGIQFLRGSRARLSRMPQLYGRKRRNNNRENGKPDIKRMRDKDSEQTDWINKNDRLNYETNFSTGIASPDLSTEYFDTTSNLDSKDWKKRLDRHLYEKFRFSDSRNNMKFVQGRSSVPSNSRKRAELSFPFEMNKEVPNIETSRRSTLSRMPLTFGKRSNFGVRSTVLAEIRCRSGDSGEALDGDRKRNELNRNDLNPARGSLRMNTRLFKPLSGILGENEPNVQEDINSKNKFGTKTKTASLHKSPEENIHSDKLVRTGKRSSLRRMPLTYGKRNILREEGDGGGGYPGGNTSLERVQARGKEGGLSRLVDKTIGDLPVWMGSRLVADQSRNKHEFSKELGG